MEVEFDKEMDAILRKNGGGLAVRAAPGGHLDADATAAFAENSLPDKARLLYTQHLADCDRCRRLLAQTVSLFEEPQVRAAVPASVPVAEAAVPWYAGLFGRPGMALAFGALIVVFAGGLILLMINRGSQKDNVAQVSEPERRAAVPSSGIEGTPSAQPTADALTAEQTANNVSANAPATTSSASNTAAAPAKPIERPEMSHAEGSGTGAARPSDNVTAGAVPADEAPKLAFSAPPPPPPVALDTSAKTEAEEKKLLKERARTDADKDDAALTRSAESTMRQQAPMPAAKASPRSGPVQMSSNQVGNVPGEMPVRRVVGGRTFTNKDGAWYDSAYQGQATTNVRRGTPEYQKLDSGLRSIASQLSGTAVIVWKGKAYRIN